ncbi:threonine--tRNA ligase [Kaarinaea lacus]
MKSHRDIAEQLDLFHSDPMGPGMIFWHPNGWRLFQSVLNHMRRVYRRNGFREINTPILLKQNLWQVSGHRDKFADNMFWGGDLQSPAEYSLKPMSCPAHILYYRRGVYSYRDLPFRIFEFGTVHRNEPSGSLNGCLRLRQFTQDDAHVFCTWEQAEAEIIAFLERARIVYGDYGYHGMVVKVSTQPDNCFGERADWERAENLLASSCRAAGYVFEYQVGEGAFYGPKIELSLKDAMGREWQCGTIQLDFNLPQRFDISYVDKDQQYRRPVILHQAMYGSIERWIGVLLESYQGKLPAWVHPVPVAVATVVDDAVAYAREIEQLLLAVDIPVMIDASNNTVSRKIKRFHELYVPFVLVVGHREVAEQSINMRLLEQKDNQLVRLDALVNVIENKLAAPA